VLQAEDRLVFTIRIMVHPDHRTEDFPGAGWASLEQIERPNVRRLRGFASRFAIKNAGERNLPDQRAREFDYELRPRNAAVKEIPAFAFVYFKPGMTPDYRGYQAALAPAIPLTVRPLTQVKLSEVVGTYPVESAPESVYTIAEGPGLLRRDNGASPGPLVLTLLVAGPPLLWAAWLIWWKRRHPGFASEARQRRSRAAARALQALRRLKLSEESDRARTAGAILVEYLREHLGFTALEPGPDEIASFLESLHLPAEKTALARAFFKDCLAARFGPRDSSMVGVNWIGTPAELIDECERQQHGAGKATIAESASWASLAAPFFLAVTLGAGLVRSAFGDDLPISPAIGSASESKDDISLLNYAAASFHEGMKLRDRPEEAQKKFLAAADAYTALEERGFRSAPLARNAGNTYLLGGDLPQAILQYRQGLHLEPADPLLRANLAYARAQVAYPEMNGFARPAEGFPFASFLRAWFGFGLFAAAVLYVLGWLGLARWRTRRTARAFAVCLGSFLLTTCLGVLLAFDASQDHDERTHPVLVVAQDEVFLRKGNGFSYPARVEIPINRGVEARLLHRRGNWLQIELSSGEIGWIPQASAILSAVPLA
jgi:hypothetical protein